ncbi:MAG: helix-turn-helix domain-containing protein [Terracidiphilus sp.]|jgi:excisionase family DNA binding protein
MATQSITPAPDGASPLLSDYIDKPALARELGRTVRTLDRLVLCDGLPCVQVGHRRLFRREAVLAWLRSRETPTPRPQTKSVRGAR